MRHAASHPTVPRRPRFARTPAALAAAVLFSLAAPAWAQTTTIGPVAEGQTLSTVTVNASADASAQGLSPAYAGGQVASKLAGLPIAKQKERMGIRTDRLDAAAIARLKREHGRPAYHTEAFYKAVFEAEDATQ